jgi:hypothetical protein
MNESRLQFYNRKAKWKKRNIKEYLEAKSKDLGKQA